MGIEAMTTSPSWRQLETPPSLLSGLEWVSATATRNFVLRNPLVDWLDRYGKKKGFVRDTDLPGYDERLEFVPFIMKKGEQFEAAVALHLGSLAPMVTIAQGRDDVRDMVAAERTFQALCEGTPRVHQAVLRDAATRTYGAAPIFWSGPTCSLTFSLDTSPLLGLLSQLPTWATIPGITW